MANESGSFLLKGLDPADLNDLARCAKAAGTSTTAIIRDAIHREAEKYRAERTREQRRAVVNKLVTNRTGRPALTRDEILAGLDTDRTESL